MGSSGPILEIFLTLCAANPLVESSFGEGSHFLAAGESLLRHMYWLTTSCGVDPWTVPSSGILPCSLICTLVISDELLEDDFDE